MPNFLLKLFSNKPFLFACIFILLIIAFCLGDIDNAVNQGFYIDRGQASIASGDDKYFPVKPWPLDNNFIRVRLHIRETSKFDNAALLFCDGEKSEPIAKQDDKFLFQTKPSLLACGKIGILNSGKQILSIGEINFRNYIAINKGFPRVAVLTGTARAGWSSCWFIAFATLLAAIFFLLSATFWSMQSRLPIHIFFNMFVAIYLLIFTTQIVMACMDYAILMGWDFIILLSALPLIFALFAYAFLWIYRLIIIVVTKIINWFKSDKPGVVLHKLRQLFVLLALLLCGFTLIYNIDYIVDNIFMSVVFFVAPLAYVGFKSLFVLRQVLTKAWLYWVFCILSLVLLLSFVVLLFNVFIPFELTSDQLFIIKKSVMITSFILFAAIIGIFNLKASQLQAGPSTKTAVTNKVLIIVGLILISCIVFYKAISQVGVFENVDAAFYVTSGLSLIDEKIEGPFLLPYKELKAVGDLPLINFHYPNVLYQLTAASFLKYLADIKAPSRIALLNMLVIFLCVGFIYLIARDRLSRKSSFFIVIAFLILPVFEVFSFYIKSVQTEPWLALFTCFGAWLAINNRPLLAGAVFAVGNFYRVQILQFIVFLPILFSPPRTKKSIIYLVSFGVCLGAISTLLQMFFHFGEVNSSLDYYIDEFMSGAISFHSISFAIQQLITCTATSNHLYFLKIFFPIIFLAVVSPISSSKTIRMALFTVGMCFIIYIGHVIYTIKYSPNYILTRYFIYCIPFVFLSTCFFIADCYKHYFKGKTILNLSQSIVVGLLLVSVLSYGGFVVLRYSPQHFIYRLNNMDFDYRKDDMPQRHHVIAMATDTLHYRGLRLYTFFGSRNLISFTYPQEFLEGCCNNRIDYLVFGMARNAPTIAQWTEYLKKDIIKDEKGVTFKSLPYTPREHGYYDLKIYKRVDNSKADQSITAQP